jgi:hypothetical protein
MSNNDSDDDQPRLSSNTLAALEEFLKEKEEQKNLLNYTSRKHKISDILFDEDWVSC